MDFKIFVVIHFAMVSNKEQEKNAYLFNHFNTFHRGMYLYTLFVYFYIHIKDSTNTIKWWSDTFQAMFYCKYQILSFNLTLQTFGIFKLGKIIFDWANQYCIPNNCLQIKQESRHSDYWTENWRHSLELLHVELKNNLAY